MTSGSDLAYPVAARLQKLIDLGIFIGALRLLSHSLRNLFQGVAVTPRGPSSRGFGSNTPMGGHLVTWQAEAALGRSQPRPSLACTKMIAV